jgi:hypothetical protein
MLNNQQVDMINDRLVSLGLTDDIVRIDLIDHVCTLTEVFMESGDSFESASDKAFAEFKPQEFEQIQELSLYYIHLKQNKMKKAIGIFGIVTSSIILTGVMFKLQYWPGAGMLLVVGLALTGLFVLPTMAFVGFSKNNSLQSTVSYLAGYTAAILACLCALFVLQQWPGGRMLGIAAMVVMCLVFMPLYIIKSYRTSENKILGLSKSFLILSGILLFWGLLQKPRAKPNDPTQQTSEVSH